MSHPHDADHTHDPGSDAHHPHAHGHPHEHEHDDLTEVAHDLSIPDSELSPAELSRRGMLRAAGITGALVAGMSGMQGVTPAAAAAPAPGYHRGRGRPPARYWLAGDHHIHTQYSSDGDYRVIDQAQHAAAYGLDWFVITDHGGATHARIGVDLVNPGHRRGPQGTPRHADLPGPGVEHPGC